MQIPPNKNRFPTFESINQNAGLIEIRTEDYNAYLQ